MSRRREITAADVVAVIATQNADITDLAREYGLSGRDDDMAERPRRGQRERASRVAEDFMAKHEIGLAGDVADVALRRAGRTFLRMNELVADLDETDPRGVALAVSYLAASWMAALTVGIALGRRFPLEAEKEV